MTTETLDIVYDIPKITDKPSRHTLCHPAFIAGSPSAWEMPQRVRHDTVFSAMNAA
jgi:hypothetical protein